MRTHVHKSQSKAGKGRCAVALELRSRAPVPFLFQFHHPRYVASLLRCLPHGSRWPLKLQPSDLSSGQKVGRSRRRGAAKEGGKRKHTSQFNQPLLESSPGNLTSNFYLYLLVTSRCNRIWEMWSLSRALAPTIEGPTAKEAGGE